MPPRLRPTADMGVLDVTKAFGHTTGGVRTYLLQKARYVEARPTLRQTLVVPGAGSELRDGDGVRQYCVWGPTVPTQHPYRFLWAAPTLRRILEHERPDVIEIGSPFFVPWITAWANRRLRVPAVWFYHGNLPHLVAPLAPGGGAAAPVRRAVHAAVWAYVRRVSRLVRVVLVASDAVAHELERHGVRNVRRVPLGVDLDLFHPRRGASAPETRRRVGLPDGPLAMYVGRLAREKRLDVPIAAWAEVERRTGARLVMVGDGPSRRFYQCMPGADRVIWLPYVTDRERLADLLAAVDLYVAPGPAETFGLAAVEAMASGCPVLSVDAGGVPELVRRSGAGDVYRRGDPGSCCEAAVRLLGRDLSALRAAARRYTETHHAWDHAFGMIFDVYRSVTLGGCT